MSDSNRSDPLPHRARATLDRLRGELLQQRNDRGHWRGELSPSALSTATAVSAMSAIVIFGSDVSDESVGESEPARSTKTPDQAVLRRQIADGIGYLAGQQNPDGGYGDTDRSHSNIATSYLVLAASALAHQAIGHGLPADRVADLESSVARAGAIEGLRARYGKDKTFVVPILTNMAIAGLVDWKEVAPLPFEAAVFPQSMYRFLGMPVVSYAIPALVAIGQARHFLGPRTWLPLRVIRGAAVAPTLKVLRRMQPESGGYLEATPLTAFVVMSLAASGRGGHAVCRHGLQFLSDSMTDEGSWPIDTDLATWVTSLAIHALACDPDDEGAWCDRSLVRWHLDCQHRTQHPFTGARPGGWGWSDLSGAVPDSDDTPAAILAQRQLLRWVPEVEREAMREAIRLGRAWLLQLQNRDGGWPTFCRGWGKLPFDRSSTDLTGHAIRALVCSEDPLAAETSHSAGTKRGSLPGEPSSGDKAGKRARERARTFLTRQQQADGSWLPLWFGNQDREDESNPIYGTARVLLAANQVGIDGESIGRACRFLTATQNSDGGWGGGESVSQWLREHAPLSAENGERVQGGGAERDAALAGDSAASQESISTGLTTATIVSSVEETALAVEALATIWLENRNLTSGNGVESSLPGHGEGGRHESGFPAGGNEAARVAIIRGIEFLLRSVDDGRHRVPWPIGFYFAKLWYHERLYPLVFTTAAIGKYLTLVSSDDDADWPR